MDGSFITEVHFVARTAGVADGSAISNASFWAEELSDFNTGASFLTLLTRCLMFM